MNSWTVCSSAFSDKCPQTAADCLLLCVIGPLMVWMASLQFAASPGRSLHLVSIESLTPAECLSPLIFSPANVWQPQINLNNVPGVFEYCSYPVFSELKAQIRWTTNTITPLLWGTWFINVLPAFGTISPIKSAEISTKMILWCINRI